jgi:hypothetical protein
MNMQRLLTAGLLGLLLPAICLASHGQAVVGDSIDGDGNGTYSGNYTQSGTNHPWYTMSASAGDTLQIDLATTFGAGTNSQGSYLWLYRVGDDNAQVGDTAFGATPDLTSVANSSNNDTDDFLDQSITYNVTATGQYIVQVDSWLGGSGDFRLTIAGANASVVPEPASLAIFGCVSVLGVCRLRRRNRQES